VKEVPHPNSDAYLLARIPAEMAAALGCSEEERSGKPKGVYYVSASTIRGKEGTASTLAVVWKKVGDSWMVHSFSPVDEAKATLAAGKSENAQKAAAAVPVTWVEGDKELVESATAYLSTWIVDKNYTKSLSYMLPESFGCVDKNFDDPVAPTAAARKRAFRSGMQRLAEAAHSSKEFADSIRAPAVIRPNRRVVKHEHQDRFLLLSIADQAEPFLKCGERLVASEVEAEIGSNVTYGRLYASAFQMNVGGSPGAVFFMWKKTPQGWRIFYWQVEMP
jgi:hypothetical protein